ncbi:MAG: zinc carboxypeptidase [Saprospiraceae bacterium]|nr:zinc carboxypeptidase [Bacteroidia bacterium]NNE14412.1 zinc carboxypeptidase [Saprospiraceae bacterium]NNL91692.1 zinc carboxypeptidase [Saprospiraceae bacterium]
MNFRIANVLIVIIIFAKSFSTFGQVDLNYYLPEIEYDENIPTPEAVLGFQVGEWHATHGQVYLYMKTVCEQSNKCVFTEYARSHEQKALIYLTITSEDNLADIENIRESHLRLTDPKTPKLNVSEMPLVLYQGYSIHGNESSGANAALMNAYYLLAGKSEKIEKLLDNTVILLDPVYNPDGLQRFSTWANSHKHLHLVSDTKSREFNEVWPGGRTNHYWFDLNRDWLFNIHPSSKGRIETFHKWKPDILTDHHEMGSNSTFFFQPGIPSRTNPNTPQINQDLTEEIGEFHASFLDSIGSLYYTKESFDDYYYGKGSTYPDINGCIGILFEQASSRGHLRETSNGIMSFPFTIRNQVVTSLSTQEAALALREDILNYKQDFFRKRYNDSNAEGYYIFQTNDIYKANFFLGLLKRHQIDVYQNDNDKIIQAKKFKASESYIVPKKQNQTALIKTIFESVNTFRDSLFYDVSAWTIPMALNIIYGESKKAPNLKNLSLASEKTATHSDISISTDAYAVAFDWDNIQAPTLLYKLLDKGLNVKALTKATDFKTNGSFRNFKQGTIVVPLSNQPIEKEKLITYLNKASAKMSQKLYRIDTGISPNGFSLGSPKQSNLIKPSVAMVIGDGVNAYEAGDNWYQFDHRLDMPVTMIDKKLFRRTSLDRYNVIILPDGSYSNDERFSSKLINWVSSGGTLIALRRSLNYTKTIGLTPKLENKTIEAKSSPPSYDGYSNSRGAQVIGGAIYKTNIDTNHPLFFGYSGNQLPIFKRGTQFYKVKNKLASPMTYTNSPLLSGYSSSQNIEKARGAAGIICYGYGGGRIIGMIDNPNFRGYWLGGSQLFANALFFSKLINSGTLEK